MLKQPQQTQTLVEVPNSGKVALLGKPVEIRCNVYIYCGILVGINNDCVELDNACIVYETGPFNSPEYKDAQKLNPPDGQLVMYPFESMGPTNKKF